MDKTLKLKAFTEPAHAPAQSEAPPASQVNDKINALEQILKDAQIENERQKLEQLKTIVQLRESLKQEQTKVAELSKKMAELEAGAKNAAASVSSELAKKTAQLEEEKQHSLELMRTVEQLRESLKQEQAKSAGATDKAAELEAKTKEIAALDAKLKDLNGVLTRIVSIAEAGKQAGNA